MTVATSAVSDDLASLDLLEENVVLLATTIRWWRGQYQVPRDTVHVTAAGSDVDETAMTIPRAKLITDQYPLDSAGTAWKKRFQKLESRLNAVKDRYSVPFPINAVRIIPRRRVGEYMEELYGWTLGRLREEISVATDERQRAAWEAALEDAERQYGREAPDTTVIRNPCGSTQSIAWDLQVAVNEFCEQWDDIQQQIRENNPLYPLVSHRIPQTVTQLRAKFSLDVTPVALLAEQSTQNASVEELLQQFGPTVREATRRRVEEAIEEMIRGPREQLAQALAALSDLVARNGRVTARSFRPVRAAIEKLRMFEFVSNAELAEQMDQLEQLLERTDPGGLDNVTAAATGFSDALASVMKTVSDEARIAEDLERFGNVRALSLLPDV